MITLSERLIRCAAGMGAVAVVAAGLLLGSSGVLAQSCMQDVWQAHGNSQGLNCTANDVSLSSVSNICIPVHEGSPQDQDGDGCQDPNAEGKLTCVSGQSFYLYRQLHHAADGPGAL